MVSQFYTRKEVATRMAVFLIQGVATIFFAFLGIFLLPHAPLDTWWLTPEERQLAHARIQADITGRREASSTTKGLWEAVTDYRTWVFCLMINLHLSANGFKKFMPTVVKTLGFAVAWGTLNTGVRYFATILFVGATYGVINIGMGWVASTLGQTNEKKAVAVAFANTLGNLDSAYTPYLWPDSDAPRFGTAMGASIGFSAGVVVCAWVMRWILMRDKRRIRVIESEAVNFFAY